MVHIWKVVTSFGTVHKRFIPYSPFSFYQPKAFKPDINIKRRDEGRSCAKHLLHFLSGLGWTYHANTFICNVCDHLFMYACTFYSTKKNEEIIYQHKQFIVWSWFYEVCWVIDNVHSSPTTIYFINLQLYLNNLFCALISLNRLSGLIIHNSDCTCLKGISHIISHSTYTSNRPVSSGLIFHYLLVI